MNKLIVALPYCKTDAPLATRLLNWIKELDGHLDHHLLLVADSGVPVEIKRALDELGKSIFSTAYTIEPKCPEVLGENYHPAAARMFERTAYHIDQALKWNWLWMEPDCVPLQHGWLDALSEAYENCPKRFMGAVHKTNQLDVPPTVMFATAIYPNCAHEELKQFCDGKTAFDMAFSPYVVPRAQNTNLIFHAFGAPGDAPRFKEVKAPEDGPNVGTLSVLPSKAVLFHRNKDGSLIELLRKKRLMESEMMPDNPIVFQREPEAPKRGRVGRPREIVETINK
jgi:hypothetical protein